MAERLLQVPSRPNPEPSKPSEKTGLANACTYRKAVLHNRCQIGYPIQQDAEQDNTAQDELSFDQPVIPPSLVWRFVGWLGGLSRSLDKAREMILKLNPNSLCHRIVPRIDPDKVRSDERLRTLETAQVLLLVTREWEELHGRKFFPRFATRSGFD